MRIDHDWIKKVRRECAFLWRSSDTLDTFSKFIRGEFFAELGHDKLVRVLQDHILAGLGEAEPYFLTDRCGVVVKEAAVTLPTTTLREELFPTQSGIIVPEYPLPILATGVEDDASRIVAFGWSWQIIEIMDGRHVLFFWYGTIAGRDRVDPPSMFFLSKHRIGDDILVCRHDDAGTIVAGDLEGQPTGEILDRIALTFLLFVEDRLLMAERRRPPRSVRRRLERQGEDWSDVLLVTLRRIKSKPNENPGTGKPLDHRHYVRGHWRVPKRKDGAKVPKFIPEFIRGPDWGELRPKKERAYNVRR